MFIWDYDLPKNYQPKTPKEWEWFLVRKINYGDFKGLKKTVVEDYFKVIADKLDPGKKAMLENYLYR